MTYGDGVRIDRHHCSACLPSRSWAACDRHCGAAAWPLRWAGGVPDCVRAFSAGTPLVLRNPGAVRPWQHVLDPLRGFLLLAERLFAGGGAYAEGWNFGPSEANTRPVGYIVEKLARHWDAATWRMADGKQPHEAVHVKIDASKARVASAAGHRPGARLDRRMVSQTTGRCVRARPVP
jgi:nucleoside-diphosphate-sugar epimerase